MEKTKSDTTERNRIEAVENDAKEAKVRVYTARTRHYELTAM